MFDTSASPEAAGARIHQAATAASESAPGAAAYTHHPEAGISAGGVGGVGRSEAARKLQRCQQSVASRAHTQRCQQGTHPSPAQHSTACLSLSSSTTLSHSRPRRVRHGCQPRGCRRSNPTGRHHRLKDGPRGQGQRRVPHPCPCRPAHLGPWGKPGGRPRCCAAGRQCNSHRHRGACGYCEHYHHHRSCCCRCAGRACGPHSCHHCCRADHCWRYHWRRRSGPGGGKEAARERQEVARQPRAKGPAASQLEEQRRPAP